MTRPDFDILILGSGPSGVQAAKEATLQGARVGLVDVGHEDHHYAAITPDKPFSELRRNDPNQQQYFLGEELEGVKVPDQKIGAQLTPARQFIIRDTETLLPLEAQNFQAMQSLALGGLAASWGAGCACYEADELVKVGLPQQEMTRYYERVAQEIGVSGPKADDTTEHVAMLQSLQAPLEPDSNAQALWDTYQQKSESMRAKGFKLGRPMTAILTEALGTRQPNPYHDMDFWSDARESVYRPRYTLRELQSEPNFTYLRPYLAETFAEAKDGTVSLFVHNLKTEQDETLQAKRLLLGAGAINTARLVLRSLREYGTRVPILSNSYTYLPTINWPMLGRAAQDRRHSMVQLTGVFLPSYEPEERMIAQFYSYRSLLLFKLARDMPLPPSLAMLMGRAIVSSLLIVGLSHADEASPKRWLALIQNPDESDSLRIHSERTLTEKVRQFRREWRLLKLLITLKLVPMMLMHLPEGASIHYAGTLPFSDEVRPLTCESSGRLHGMQHVYVVDGAPWKYLPAKGLTLTLMANARRVAQRVACELKERSQ